MDLMHVVILGRNQGVGLLRSSVDSVLTQAYPYDRRFLWLYDDGSDDPATLEALEMVCSSSDDGAVIHQLDVELFSQNDTKLPRE